MGNMEKALWNLADACLEAGERERPEKQWLGRMYDRFREANRSLGKAEADELIYMKMYAQIPGKPSDTLKIRYWRTGRHLPVSREQCLSFGKALDLSEEEISGEKEIVKDLGADSLDIVEMLMTLEDEHHITVPDNETEGIKTVQDVVDLVGKYI